VRLLQIKVNTTADRRPGIELRVRLSNSAAFAISRPSVNCAEGWTTLSAVETALAAFSCRKICGDVRRVATEERGRTSGETQAKYSCAVKLSTLHSGASIYQAHEAEALNHFLGED
jgi:hypothetical protein